MLQYVRLEVLYVSYEPVTDRALWEPEYLVWHICPICKRRWDHESASKECDQHDLEAVCESCEEEASLS